jgi:CRISPR/Cas system-associated protein Csx1
MLLEKQTLFATYFRFLNKTAMRFLQKIKTIIHDFPYKTNYSTIVVDKAIQDKFSWLLDNVSSCIVYVNADQVIQFGIITSWNKVAERCRLCIYNHAANR